MIFESKNPRLWMDTGYPEKTNLDLYIQKMYRSNYEIRLEPGKK
jgi:hypothetical protein